jgi:hypothetical protein
MKLIDKSALVAEIEKLIERAKAERVLYPKTLLAAKNYLLIEDYNKLLSFINTLEVKEVLEEPISDDLEEEIIRYIGFPQEVDEDVSTTMIRKAAHHFANWQKEQFEKNRLAHCDALTKEQAQMESDFVTKHLKENNRTPTFIDAIKYGMKLQKEQMMKDAVVIETSMMEDDCDDLTHVIGDMRNKGFKFGDRVKLIIIKEKQ